MSERKGFCSLKLETINRRNQGFTKIKPSHAFQRNCELKDQEGCVHRENGYHCFYCLRAKSDCETASTCFTNLGFTLKNNNLDNADRKPFGYRVVGEKQVGPSKIQYLSFNIYNGVVTLSSITFNTTE